MEMFASDLDRTLIYSDRALADFNETGKDNLMSAEFKDGREVAHMTRKAAETLRQLAENMLFVPVTTRTFAQFNRVSLISQSIPLTYAVTSNGANIIYKGRPLDEWTHLVHDRLHRECMDIEELTEKISGVNINGVIKNAENLFFYYILEEMLSEDTIHFVKNIAIESGWRISIQGRKLYFMPNPICKGEAVKFIKQRENISSVYGAGDSILDHDFLKECDFSIVPSHGELANENTEGFSYTYTKNRGVMAGEEILLEIAKKCLFMHI
ncbi:hypothetical protein [Bacillus sp. S/N-304-OC-R1]|uniref:hypothetical protein n=1 Tax=Bacillus sp. S/N-304-OC-R1 TaxID=2758034 RepID=UPI001C8E591A|nr:hypothetical protein [Bacillus sp. S/N-304-OC-R1]MBY0122700.1 hypothetical protein [Bacillus sp. S/N-304-OC-R1]